MSVSWRELAQIAFIAAAAILFVALNATILRSAYENPFWVAGLLLDGLVTLFFAAGGIATIVSP